MIRREIKGCNALSQSIVHIVAYVGSVRYAEFLKELATSKREGIDEQVVSRVRGVLLEFFTQKDKEGNDWVKLAEKEQTTYPTKVTPEEK